MHTIVPLVVTMRVIEQPPPEFHTPTLRVRTQAPPPPEHHVQPPTHKLHVDADELHVDPTVPGVPGPDPGSAMHLNNVDAMAGITTPVNAMAIMIWIFFFIYALIYFKFHRNFLLTSVIKGKIDIMTIASRAAVPFFTALPGLELLLLTYSRFASSIEGPLVGGATCQRFVVA